MKAKLIKTVDGYELFTQGFLKGLTNHGLIDSLNIEEGSIRYKLSLKNCEAIANGYDLDELALNFVSRDGIFVRNPYNEAGWIAATNGFVEGFQKALEILGDKKFSEDDVNLAFVLGKNKDESRINKLINSKLQQTEWDVEILIDNVLSFEANQIDARVNPNFSNPLLDADGCLILKRK